MTTNPSKHIPNLPERYTAAELNLSRLPFFASSTKNLKDKTGITYTDTIRHEDREVELVWEVTGNAKYGYPGPFAESVHSALLDIITERGLPFENPVVFSFYDICKRLDIQHNGKNIRSIRKAILSIRLAGIVIENSFVTKDGRRLSYTPDPTFLYKRIALYGDTNPTTGEEMNVSAVWLSDFYLQSLNSGNIRPIDFEYFKYLHGRSYAATKIYQYLGYRFSGTFHHDNDYAKTDYDDLTTIADVKRQPYLSQAKQKLEKAHDALLDTEFLSHIEWNSKSRPDAPNKFHIYYYPGKRARKEYRNGRLKLDQQFELPLLTDTDKQEGAPDEDLEEAIDRNASDEPKTTLVFAHELKKLGITAERAKELDQKYSEERITRQLDHLDYLSERGKSPDNPAAWLVSAIEKDYETPDGFKTREEKKAEQKARAKAAKRKQREQEKKEQKRREEEARRKRLERQLDELPEEQQQEIEETITDRLREAHKSLIQRVYSGKDIDFKAIPFRADYYDHLEELLNDQGKLE